MTLADNLLVWGSSDKDAQDMKASRFFLTLHRRQQSTLIAVSSRRGRSIYIADTVDACCLFILLVPVLHQAVASNIHNRNRGRNLLRNASKTGLCFSGSFSLSCPGGQRPAKSQVRVARGRKTSRTSLLRGESSCSSEILYLTLSSR